MFSLRYIKNKSLERRPTRAPFYSVLVLEKKLTNWYTARILWVIVTTAIVVVLCIGYENA